MSNPITYNQMRFIMIRIATILLTTSVIMLGLVDPSQSRSDRDRTTTDITTKLSPCGHFMGNNWSLEVSKQDNGYSQPTSNPCD
jgi:hypothetical protein